MTEEEKKVNKKEDADNQPPKQRFNLAKYMWKPGQSGNPAGRPKGKTMKEFAREYLTFMSNEDRIEFLNMCETIDVWKMAEGNPKESVDHSIDVMERVRLDKKTEKAIKNFIEKEKKKIK